MEYRIGELSSITKLSIRTLRYYQEIGLLLPAKTDESTGYRYYDEKGIQKAALISSLKSLNFSLDEIKTISNDMKGDVLQTVLKEKLAELDKSIVEITEAKNRLIACIALSEDKAFEEHGEIVFKNVPHQYVASTRFTGRYEDIGNEMNKLFSAYGGKIRGIPFSMYYDNDSKPDDADIEICLPVNHDENDKSIKTIEGGRAIAVTHSGSYETLYKSYKKIIDYAKINNIEIRYPIREYYIKGKNMYLNSSDNLVTEIVVLYY